MNRMYNCIKCGQRDIPNQLEHLKYCNPDNYQKAIKLYVEIENILNEKEQLERDITVLRAELNQLRRELK